MRKKAYIDCEYYVISLDQASLTLGGRRVHSPIPLGMELLRLGQECLGDATTSQDELLWKGIETLNRDPEVGVCLFHLLFPKGSELARLFEERHRQRMHFRLQISPKVAYLHKILWESLSAPALAYSELQGELPFARRERIFFSRQARGSCRLQPHLEPRLKVLIAVAAAEPTPGQEPSWGREATFDRLSATELRAGLDRIFKDKEHRKVYDIEYLDLPVTPSALRDKLATGGFHVLHLIAHGAIGSQSALLLQTEDDDMAPIDGNQLTELIPKNQTLRLILMMACHSAEPIGVGNPTSLTSGLIDKGFPTVAIQGEIDTDSALAFSESFYGDLRCFGRVDRAANSGRQALYAARTMEDRFGAYAREAQHWARPVLFTQKDGTVIWKPNEEAKRRRQQLVSSVVSLLIFVALLIDALLSRPLPVEITSTGTPSNPVSFTREEQAVLKKAFALALDRTGVVDVSTSIPEGEPHLEIAVTLQDPLSDGASPTLRYKCSEVGFPRGPSWWPKGKARRLCDGNGRSFAIAPNKALVQIEDNVRRDFGAHWEFDDPRLSRKQGLELERAAIAFLLLRAPQLPEAPAWPWMAQVREASLATRNTYYEALRSRPRSAAPNPKASLSANLFLQAQKLFLTSADEELRLAVAIFSVLENNRASSQMPISEAFLQIQRLDLEARLDLEGATEALDNLAGGCDGPTETSTRPTRQDERLAACFKKAQLIGEHSRDFAELDEARSQALARLPDAQSYRRVRHELQILGAQSTITQVSSGIPLARASLGDTYAELAQRLAQNNIEMVPRTLPSTTSGAPFCPTIGRVAGSPPDPVAAAIDLALVATLLGVEEIRALGSRESILLEKRCAIETFRNVIDHLLPELKNIISTVPDSGSDPEPLEYKIDIYANVARTNFGLLLYCYGDPSDNYSVNPLWLHIARSNLQQSYRFFRTLPIEHQNRWTSTYLAQSRGLLAPLLVELGYYGASHRLAVESKAGSFSALMIKVKTDTMRNISQDYSELTRKRLALGQEHGGYKSMFLFLEAQNRYLEGDIEATVQDIERLRNQLPDEQFSRHLQRLYARLLLEQGRFPEAEAALDRLPQCMNHSRVKDVENLLDALAWAQYWMTRGNPHEAERAIAVYASAIDVRVGDHLSPIGALLPEVFTTAGRIALQQGDLEAAELYRQKAVDSLAEVQRLDDELIRYLVDESHPPADATVEADSDRGFWFVSVELPLTLFDYQLELEQVLTSLARQPMSAARVDTLRELAAKVPPAPLDLPLWTHEFDLLRTRIGFEMGDRSMLASQLEDICSTHASAPPTCVRLRTAAAELARQAKLPTSPCYET